MWRSADKASEAAEAMGVTSERLKKLGLIDKIITEPLGGAHRNPKAMMQTVKKALADALIPLQSKPTDELLAGRMEKIMAYGNFALK